MYRTNRADMPSVRRTPLPVGRARPHTRVAALLRAMAREKWAYGAIAFPLGLFLLFGIYPVIWTFIISLQVFHPQASVWCGLLNYRIMLSYDVFLISLRNTVYYTLFTVPPGVLLALGMSILVFRVGRRAQGFYKSAYYLPGVTSGVILALVWRYMFNPAYGLMNYLLSLFDVGPVNWLGSSSTALPSLVFMAVAGGQGVSIIILTAAMGAIPRELFESAEIDGAGDWTKFTRITIPLILPSILYVLVISTIGSFQVFEPVYLMTKGGPNYATSTVVYTLYDTAFVTMNFSLGAAESVFLFCVIALVSFVQYRALGTSYEY